MQHNKDLVFRVDERFQKPRQACQRQEDEKVLSPRLLTIRVPTAPQGSEYPVRPPEEIVIGDPGKKPPQTIELKGSCIYSPPPSVVVIQKKATEGGVPDVIEVDSMPTTTTTVVSKQESSSSHNLATTSNTKENHQLQKKNHSVKSHHKRTEQRFVEAFDKFQHAAAAHNNNHSATQHLQKQQEASAAKEVRSGEQRPIHDKPDTIIAPPVTSHLARSITASAKKQQTSSLDPPAAIAPTTTHKVLPDFSAMAYSRQRRHSTAATPRRRKNVLDESNNDNKMLHHSWPVPLKNTMSDLTSIQQQRTTPIRRTNNHHHRAPQWLGVTGTPEEWIRATTTGDIQEIGRKIASQRIEI